MYFELNDKIYYIKDFDYIWIRRFNKSEFFYKEQFNYIEEKYLKSEWDELFDSIFTLYNDKLVTPTTIKICITLQLIKAKEVGFQIPDTIISNSSSEITEFFENKECKIFSKALKHHSLTLENGSLVDYYGRTFNNINEVQRENTQAAPVIYQNQIDKNNSQEFRINVFNNCVSAFTYLNIKEDDWHFEDITGIEMKKVDIPSEIKTKILALFKKLKLVIGTADIIRCGDAWYFLEINIGGDWKWVENASGENITANIRELF